MFSPVDGDTISVLVSKLNRYLSGFVATSGIQNLSAQKDVLYEIVDRIEKRKVYFHIFYNGCEMGELNEGSLMCFWILKLTPFTSSRVPTSALNARIAVSVFFSVLFYIAKIRNKKVNSTKEIIEDIFYSFRFRDLSKEAIMLLAESLIH
jgi:hypothetical protein